MQLKWTDAGLTRKSITAIIVQNGECPTLLQFIAAPVSDFFAALGRLGKGDLGISLEETLSQIGLQQARKWANSSP